jgi:hypothetical protein
VWTQEYVLRRFATNNKNLILLKLFKMTVMIYIQYKILVEYLSLPRGYRGRMVVGLTTAYEISAYHHLSCEFKPCSWQGVLNTTL